MQKFLNILCKTQGSLLISEKGGQEQVQHNLKTIVYKRLNLGKQNSRGLEQPTVKKLKFVWSLYINLYVYSDHYLKKKLNRNLKLKIEQVFSTSTLTFELNKTISELKKRHKSIFCYLLCNTTKLMETRMINNSF